MLIDWFTVSAQLVNFLILVWLLKRLLYKPILHAIDERERRIAKELADADTKRTEAEKKGEARAESQRLLEESRLAADALRAKQGDALKREQQSLNDEITRRTREEVFAIARKTLTDLAGTSLEERMSEVFTRRLRGLSDEAKEGLARALQTSADPVLVRSAFELPEEQRAAIQRALSETFSAEMQVRFETAPGVISGIELTANGRKVAWSIAEYLASLEKSVGELLKEKDKPEAEPKPKSRTEPVAREEVK
jgi:F-type H+-transporting ATPase subunit b